MIDTCAMQVDLVAFLRDTPPSERNGMQSRLLFAFADRRYVMVGELLRAFTPPSRRKIGWRIARVVNLTRDEMRPIIEAAESGCLPEIIRLPVGATAQQVVAQLDLWITGAKSRSFPFRLIDPGIPVPPVDFAEMSELIDYRNAYAGELEQPLAPIAENGPAS